MARRALGWLPIVLSAVRSLGSILTPDFSRSTIRLLGKSGSLPNELKFSPYAGWKRESWEPGGCCGENPQHHLFCPVLTPGGEAPPCRKAWLANLSQPCWARRSANSVHWIKHPAYTAVCRRPMPCREWPTLSCGRRKTIGSIMVKHIHTNAISPDGHGVDPHPSS